MDLKIAQKRIDDLSAAMVAKGMREPEASLRLKSNGEPYVSLTWKKGFEQSRSGYEHGEFEYFTSPIHEALDKAAAFIATQPDAEQAKLHDFMAALGKVIDIGRQHGIDADYMNPLVASMKTLSENVITDQRAA